MLSNSEHEEILEATVAGIPKVAELIAAVPAERRAKALDAAKLSYLQTTRDLGYDEVPARKWVSRVMFRLRVEAQKQSAERMRLKMLHNELTLLDEVIAAQRLSERKMDGEAAS
jgi:hypothetical protein